MSMDTTSEIRSLLYSVEAGEMTEDEAFEAIHEMTAPENQVDLISAARTVLQRWEKGDLAEAVRALQAAVEGTEVCPGCENDAQATGFGADSAVGKVPHNHGPVGCTVIGHIDGGQVYTEFHDGGDWEEAIRNTPEHVTVCGVFAGHLSPIDDLHAPCQGGDV